MAVDDMPEPDFATVSQTNAPADDYEELDPSDWRIRPPKPPPRKSRWMRIIDEMTSRPDEPDESAEQTASTSTQPARDPSPEDAAPFRTARRVPREVTYEIVRAPPDVVAAFNDARAELMDAVFAWWHASSPPPSQDTPRDIDYALVRLDPRVRRAGRELQAADARLSAEGVNVRTATVRNDGGARRTMLDEAERVDAEWREAQQQKQRAAAAPRKRRRKDKEPLPPEPQEAPTPASTASTSTARTSLSAEREDTSATSPEPDDSDANSDGGAYKPSWKVKATVAATTAATSKRRRAG